MARYPRGLPPLTQLIAVLAIIGFVAAVLFPMFQRVPHPRRSVCATNMDHLGLALTEYMQNANEVYPAGSNAAGNGWAGALYVFTKSTGVYHCPKDVQEGSYISYAENRNLVKQPLANLMNPAATVTLYEFSTLNCDPSTPETVSATSLSAPQDSRRHNNPHTPFGLTFLAVDGHVRFCAPNQVSGGPQALPAQALPQGSYLETFAVK